MKDNNKNISNRYTLGGVTIPWEEEQLASASKGKKSSKKKNKNTATKSCKPFFKVYNELFDLVLPNGDTLDLREITLYSIILNKAVLRLKQWCTNNKGEVVNGCKYTVADFPVEITNDDLRRMGLGNSKDTIRRCLDTLESAGLITVDLDVNHDRKSRGKSRLVKVLVDIGEILDGETGESISESITDSAGWNGIDNETEIEVSAPVRVVEKAPVKVAVKNIENDEFEW